VCGLKIDGLSILDLVTNKTYTTTTLCLFELWKKRWPNIQRLKGRDMFVLKIDNSSDLKRTNERTNEPCNVIGWWGTGHDRSLDQSL